MCTVRIFNNVTPARVLFECDCCLPVFRPCNVLKSLNLHFSFAFACALFLWWFMFRFMGNGNCCFVLGTQPVNVTMARLHGRWRWWLSRQGKGWNGIARKGTKARAFTGSRQGQGSKPILNTVAVLNCRTLDLPVQCVEVFLELLE